MARPAAANTTSPASCRWLWTFPTMIGIAVSYFGGQRLHEGRRRTHWPAPGLCGFRGGGVRGVDPKSPAPIHKKLIFLGNLLMRNRASLLPAAGQVPYGKLYADWCHRIYLQGKAKKRPLQNNDSAAASLFSLNLKPRALFCRKPAFRLILRYPSPD